MKVLYLFCFFVLIFASCGYQYKTIPTSLYESRGARKESLKGSSRSPDGDTVYLAANNKMAGLNLYFRIHKFEPHFLDEENVYWIRLDTGYGVIKKMRPFLFFPKRWTSKKTNTIPTVGVLKEL